MNKVKMNIDYKYQYTELDENPLSSINSFNVNTLKLKLLNPDGTIYGLPTNNYSITIEIVADRGNQVYGT